MSGDHVRRNRHGWNAQSDAYQARHGGQLERNRLAWGVWSLPESELGVLGDPAGRRVLELGCGAAQWSLFLAQAGAHAVGLDASERQLHHARVRLREAGVRLPLVHGRAEELPFADASFDLVFCDHGATSYSDPARSIPEAARVLRAGGRLAFNITAPLLELCWDPEREAVGDRLRRDYFGLRTTAEAEAMVGFTLPYGEWIRLFRRCGLQVDDLVELRPPVDAATSYTDYVDPAWARRWPAENIWVLSRV